MELARKFDGKKFMWDGQVYDDEAGVKGQAQKYTADGFEVQTAHEDGKYYIFTRRVVTDIAV